MPCSASSGVRAVATPEPPAAAPTLSIAQLQQLFPFHFVIDSQLRLLQVGNGLRKLLPRIDTGARLTDHFELSAPLLPLTYAQLCDSTDSLLLFKGLQGSPVLKGQVIEAAGALLFVGGPVVTSMRGVKALGLKLNDFALHDATTDLLLLLQTQKLMNEDLQTLAAANASEIAKRQRAEDELKRAIIEARTALHSQSKFLNTISHEIRTPLHAVFAALSLLADTVAQQAEAAELVATAQQASETLLDLLANILDFAGMDAGRLGLEPEPFAADALLESVRALMEPRARDKGLALQVIGARQLPTKALLGDARRVRQILLNLLDNAIKFTERGTVSLTTSARRAPDGAAPAWQLRFEVEDTGIGIAADRLAGIFDGFALIDADYSRPHDGAGLGLAIAKRLATLMGGQLSVTSSEHHGSRFCLEIELLEHEQAPAAAVAPPPPRRSDSPNILVVEDVEVNRRLLCSMLERSGYRVDECADGLEALEAIAGRDYDLVLMDVSMPRMDGLATTRCIRELGGSGARLPIIALTAHAMRGDRETCLAAGMDDYLTKPVTSQQLLQALERWGVAARSAQQEDTNMSETQQEAAALVDRAALEQLGRDTDPAMVPELLAVFVADARERLAGIETAIGRADGTTVQNQAHTLGSSAGTFGLPALHQLARACEEAFRLDDAERGMALGRQLLAAAPAALEALSRYADAVQGP